MRKLQITNSPECRTSKKFTFGIPKNFWKSFYIRDKSQTNPKSKITITKSPHLKSSPHRGEEMVRGKVRLRGYNNFGIVPNEVFYYRTSSGSRRSSKEVSTFGIILALFVICVLYIGIFTISGCAKAPQAAKAPKQIVMWHWLTDREEALKELAKGYQALTGIEVKCELYAPSDAYAQKIMASGQAMALPDIFGLLGEKRIFAAFIEAGHIADLTDYMEKDGSKWKNIFFKKSLEINQLLPDNPYGIKPGIYGVPLDVMNIQLLYNKNLFRKAGLDAYNPPKEWPDFIAALEKLKDAGVKGFVSGWGETWLIDCFMSNYAFNIMGEQKVIDTIKGKVPYNDPDWIAVFKLFNELARKQLLVSGLVTMGNKTAEQLFANEKAGFAFNGSWCVNVYKGMNPKLEYGALLPPRITGSKYPMAIWGGAGSSFMVNGRSKNKEEAVNFLKWLTEEKQQVFLADQTLNLPSNKDSLREVTPILAEFANDMDNVTHPNLLPVQENPRVIEALTKGMQAVIIGVKTPEEVADDVQRVKETVMKEGAR